MQKPHDRPVASSNRRTALFSLGLIGAAIVGLCGLWWTAAMKTPQIHIPSPTMPKQNAFDFYVSAGNSVTNDSQIETAYDPTTGATWEQWETLVQQNVAAIDTVHQGFAYPYINPPIRSIYTLMPYYMKFRVIARLLALQGRVRAQQGDWSGAADSSLDAIHMGIDIPHGSMLIGYLVGIACQAIGGRPMWTTVEHLNAAQSRSAALRLQSILANNFSFADALQEEKWSGQADLLEIFADPKKRNAMLAPEPGEATTQPVRSMSALIYFGYSKSRIMHDYTAYMDKSIQAARQPYGLHVPLPPTPMDPINRVMIPTLSHAHLTGLRTETQNGLLLLLLALHAFRLEHGHYPASLAELTPSYLKKLPEDPFAAQGTFQYHVRGKSYTLYSVGPDGKDDGGTPIDDPNRATTTSPNVRYQILENSVGDVVAGKNIY